MESRRNHIKTYSREEILLYLSGKMPREEMYEMERAALDDPFLADAMEGYQSAPPDDVRKDLAFLDKELDTRAGANVRWYRKRAWLAVAASIFIFLCAGIGYILLRSGPASDIAYTKTTPSQKESAQISADSIEAIVPADSIQESVQADSAAVVNNTTQTDTLIAAKPTARTRKAQPPALRAEQTPGDEDISRQHRSAENHQDRQSGKVSAPGIASATEKSEPLRTDESKTITRVPGINVTPEAEGFITANLFRGRVVDEFRRPLPFVNVQSRNPGINTYSDSRGQFTVMSADTILDLRIDAAGYSPVDTIVTLRSSNPVISLRQESSALAKGKTSSTNRKKTYAAQRRANVEASSSARREAEELADSTEIEEDVEGAQPLDGWANYYAYLANNIRRQGIPANRNGLVELTFYVDQNGALSNFRVERSLCYSCDREAIRLVREGPRWTLRGTKKIRPVTVQVEF